MWNTDKHCWWLFCFKDGHLTNIDLIEPDILDQKENWLTAQHSLNYNSSFLDNFYLGRTQIKGYSDHSGQISDFNMWDRPLTSSEMKAWTTCKWAIAQINRILGIDWFFSSFIEVNQKVTS